ncbi:HlyD family type I secretion periplasmic adaptor subunit [Sneathiella glossodoripedis]|uniref:HlyD family type I secretion periplasmic adaptor subunit n=1 Tax=Sneathiella glossodoripedis TaxID=418853 RepID=UPI00056D0643|nr:HlyD family type I secretion periplasmic adaptor subunit [Sneathiella glossodoripedis]
MTSTSESMSNMGIAKPVWVGLIIIALFFGGLGGWAAYAPLGSAAIATGVVSVEGSRKTVQHFEGGIVSRILVKDGDRVEQGQPLFLLDQTQAKASLQLIFGRKAVALAEKARLEAEQSGAEQIEFSDWLTERQEDPIVSKAMEGQRNIFEARKLARLGQITILNQKIAQLNEEIKGLQSQIRSLDQQIKLINLELKDVQSLVEKKLAKMTRLRSLQRTAAELLGAKSQNIAKIAQSRQAIGEIELQISELNNSTINEVVENLKIVQAQIFDLQEQERSSKDILNRTEIVAPTDGVVVNLAVHTVGAVIASGEPLLEIVPVDQSLIVQAQVNPSDIDVVKIGAKARITFPAFSQREVSPADGIVTNVSADSLVNERTGESYYQAQVQIEDLKSANLTSEQLRPGMQADIMISTGERTALEYIMKPIIASFRKAMTEQ